MQKINLTVWAKVARARRWGCLLVCLLLGICGPAVAQDNPSIMRREAEKLIQRADVDQRSGRTTSAMGWLTDARDLYRDISDKFPLYEPETVSERLFFCRKKISEMQAEQEAEAAEDEEDDLGALLDSIEGRQAVQEQPAPDELRALTVEEREVIVEPPPSPAGKRFVKDVAAPPSAAPDASSRGQDQALASLQAQLAESEGLLAAAERDRVTWKQQAGQVAELERQLAKSRQDLAAARKSTPAQNTGDSEEISRLRAELARLEEQAKQARQREDQLRQDLVAARKVATPDDYWDAPVSSSRAASGDDRARQDIEKTIMRLEQEKANALKQVADLQSQLEKSNSSPAAATAPRRSETSGIEEENQRLRIAMNSMNEQIKDMQQQLDSYREHKDKLSDEIESTDTRWSQEVLRLKQELNRDKASLSELRETVANLRQSLRESEQSRSELLRDVQAQSATQGRTESGLAAQVSELRGKLAETMQDVAAEQRDNQVLTDLANGLKKDKRDLEDRLNALQKDYLAMANSTAATAAEMVDLKARHDRDQKDMETLRVENKAIERYVQANEQANALNKELQARLTAADERQDMLAMQLKEAETQLKATGELELRAAALQQEKAEWMQTQADLEKTILDLENYKQEMAGVTEQARMDLSKTAKSLEKAKSDAQIAQKLISSLQMRLADSQQAEEEAVRKANAAEAEARSQAIELKAQARRAIQMSVDKTRRELTQESKLMQQKLEEEISRLNQELAATQSQTTMQAAAAADQARKAAETEAASAQQKLQGEINRLNQELAQMRERAEQAELLAETQQDDVKRLQSERDLAALDSVEWNQTKSTLEDSIRELQAEKMDMEISLATITAEKNNAERLSEKLRADYTDVLTKLEEAQQQAQLAKNARQSEILDLKRQVDQLDRQLLVSEEQLGDVTRLERELKEHKELLDTSRQEQQAAMAALQKELDLQRLAAQAAEAKALALQKRLDTSETDSALDQAGAQQFAQEKAALEKQIDDLTKSSHEALLLARKEAASEKEMAARLQQDMATLQTQMKVARDEQLLIQRKLMDSEREKAALEKEVTQSDEAWRIKLADAMRDAQAARELSAAREQSIATLEHDQQTLLRKNEALAADVKLRDMKLSEREKYSAELEKKLAGTDQKESQLLVQLKTELARLEKDNEQLRTRAADSALAQADLRNREESLEALEKKLLALETRVGELNQEKKKAEETIASTRNEVESANNELAELTGRLKAEQVQSSELRRSLNATEAQLTELKTIQNELAAKQTELATAKQRTAVLEGEKAALQSALDTGKNLDGQYRELQSQLAKLLEQQEAQKHLLNETRKNSEQYSEQANNARQEAETLRQELAKTREQSKDMEQQLANALKSNELNSRLIDRMKNDAQSAQGISSQLTSINEERDTLLAQVAKLNQELDLLKTAQADSEKQRAAFEAQVAKQAEVAAALTHQLEEKEALILELNKAQAKMADLEKAASEAGQSKDSLSTELATLRKETQALSAAQAKSVKEMEKLNQRLEKAEHERTKIEAEAAELRTQAKSHQSELKAHNKERNALQKQLDEAVESRSSLEARLDKVTEQIKAQEASQELAGRQQAELQHQLELKTKEIESLTQKVQSLTQELNQATETLESLANF